MSMDFLTQTRDVTYDWHMIQVMNWLKFDAGRELDNTLIYAAFELRLAIERYFFELLFLMKGCVLTPEEEGRCRSTGGIDALMKKTDENYRKTFEFTKIFASMQPGLPEITIADTRYLRRQWHALSEYCHKQLKPTETFESDSRSFKKRGFQIIHETIARFREWDTESACGVFLPQNMEPEVRDLYDRFVAGEATEEQVRISLKLMSPALEQRFHIGRLPHTRSS